MTDLDTYLKKVSDNLELGYRFGDDIPKLLGIATELKEQNQKLREALEQVCSERIYCYIKGSPKTAIELAKQTLAEIEGE